MLLYKLPDRDLILTIDYTHYNHGVIYYKDGSMYTGEILNKQRHGHGTYCEKRALGQSLSGSWMVSNMD